MAEQVKTYRVKKLTTSLSRGVRSVPWQDVEPVSDFSYPWEMVEPPLLEFKAVHDDEWFYCFFNVVDQEVSVYARTNDKREVLYGDRVEIFLASDRSLENYYGLEINLDGRIYDYQASFYRKFNDEWSWPADDIFIDAEKTFGGYQVYLALHKNVLRELGVLKNKEMLTGLFRGKCSAASPLMDSMRWISWVSPDSEEPDFHLPGAFGRFSFE